ncbi:Flp pilus assembly protein pilin Flp [Cupriavidus necator N-1]|uniref:Flp pilus assembly protein pilin Flp n=1 Tax=Cupriavidus necator (strain ATCC 43291 / DSM 13513 / CCUG 52238 / LMG 8453 / N-1) TaxID=1042878 RepID=G0EXI0_CUPNN|nr:Flp family type IVb pilin [Cupriavidus necator]AEI76085.1 Flp pilus assembly protein pilin Flp [Cupriavidus necator N-1]KAI3609131.1 hypothetical protein D8I24_0909 [Cupriavidus necator H850]MDX6011782.1 Flp family type IVb pilin [Cupriavidus necator]
MPKLFARSRDFLRDDQGVSAIEYALLGSLIAMAIVFSVATLGDAVEALYELVASKLP